MDLETFPPSTETQEYKSEVREILGFIWVAVSTGAIKKPKLNFKTNDFSMVGEFLDWDADKRQKQRDYVSEKLGFQAYGSLVDLAKRLRIKRNGG